MSGSASQPTEIWLAERFGLIILFDHDVILSLEFPVYCCVEYFITLTVSSSLLYHGQEEADEIFVEANF